MAPYHSQTSTFSSLELTWSIFFSGAFSFFTVTVGCIWNKGILHIGPIGNWLSKSNPEGLPGFPVILLFIKKMALSLNCSYLKTLKTYLVPKLIWCFHFELVQVSRLMFLGIHRTNLIWAPPNLHCNPEHSWWNT